MLTVRHERVPGAARSDTDGVGQLQDNARRVCAVDELEAAVCAH